MNDDNTNLYFFKSFRMKIEATDKVTLRAQFLNGPKCGEYLKEVLTPIDFNFNAFSFSTIENIPLDTQLKLEISTKNFFKRWNFEVDGTITRSFLYEYNTGKINYGIKLKKQSKDSELYYFLKDFIYNCSPHRIMNYFLHSALSEKEYTQQDGVEFYSLLLALYKQISNVDLQRIINVATNFLNAREGRIYKINIENDKLETYKFSIDAHSIKNDFRDESSGKVFTSGQLLNISNDEINQSSSPFNSLLAHPLDNRKKQRIGVIEFRDKIEGRFNIRDEASIKHLSEIISLYFKDYLPHSKNSKIVHLNPILKDDYFYIGKSKTAKRVQSSLKNLKNTNSNLLIVGEKGLGKHFLAASFQGLTADTKESPNSLDCKDRPTLLEALKTHLEIFHLEEKGTLILYNIESLTSFEQFSLFKYLQHANKRIISTSRIELNELVRNSLFNQSLYTFLSKAYIHLPPLRNRKEDIIYMANYFLKIECEKREINLLRFNPKSIKSLIEYSWPGNIDELEKKIKKEILKNFHEDRENPIIELSIASPAQCPSTLPTKNTELYFALKEIIKISDLSISFKKTNQILQKLIKKAA